MGIHLRFSYNKEILNFVIKDREIYYTDRFWKSLKGWLRIIPKDENFLKKIVMSRNKIPKVIFEQFKMTKQDEEEYNNAKTEEDLADNIIKDCKKKGLLLIDKENIIWEKNGKS